MPTAYQPAANGVGYSEQQLDGSTWRVQFSGNTLTPRERVEDYLLFRAAEVMRFGGYDKFVLLEKTIEPETSYWGPGYPYGPGFGFGFGPHRRHSHLAFSSGSYLPRTRYQGSVLIRVYAPGQGGGPVFSASELIEQIRPRIVWPQQG